MQVWGIASHDDEASVRTFVDQLGLTYPILLDEDGSINSLFSFEDLFPTGVFPQDWVVGTDGLIVYGNNAYEVDEMISVIERELAE